MPTRTFSDPFKRSATSLPLLLGFTLVLIFFASSAYISYYSIQTLREITTRVAITHAVRAALEDVFSLLKDAETGQRGFVLTGDEKYLEPYAVALSRIEQQIANIKQLTAGDTEQQLRMQTIEAQLPLKLQELAETIDTRRRVGFEAARAIIMTDRGKNAMDELRQAMEAMRQDELQRLREGFAERNDAFRNAIQSVLASGLLGIVLAAVVAWLLRRADMIRYKQNWLQSGQALLAEKLLGEQQLADIGEKALNFLCDYLGANAGALFIEDKGVFRRFATYAVPSGATIAETFEAGDGLLGQAVKDKHPFIVKDVPPGYLSIGSSLGQKDPSHLLIAPTIIEGNVNAVMELGFFRPVRPAHLELLKLSAESLGASVHSARARMRIEALLEETQRQAEELQAQSEELRVSNEELEEQSQTLRHAQAELEQQQSELEQTNIQLETQKDELIQAKLGLESQARVVEQASRYKSAFLANMSHELRTPLNSSLILSQLLAENRSGNLTEEQIKYIRTIQSSGNDLLTLINDVLDLSKIEAGRMDLRPQYITIAHLIDTLRSQFSPMASNRGLALHFNVTAGAPEGIETDTQRLEQILRNLLSNALKFTEKGEVNLQISGVAPNKICFAVRDTGIGIAPDQQQLVFEPFSQADGTPSRKYGGTGLGLSISRELVHLLGGEIRLQSQVGKGSTFTVILPETLGDQHKNEVIQPASVSSSPVVSAAPVQEQPNAWPEQTVAATAAEAKQLQRKSAAIVTDDRQHLNPSQLIILVIEDDANFASILANFAHEKNFQCLVTASAHEALELARTHLPSAVILDIGLPDSSGLFVLDRLKDDPRTRHIPVHVISGSDYAEKAMAMGAAGYMLKPVPYDKLADAFKDLENLLTHRLRRVLVVEDDEVQLNALCSLLSSRDVQAIGAGNAASCLEQLQHGTFDCMVLDLSLPDASGFSLLEEISQDDSHSFPPVIIYTGRDLGTDEEQKLRRYSKSIIVKGAKSPERLLDEVALFLHQVVSELPAEQQRMIEKARSREMALEGRRVLLVEDDVRNIFALTSLLEPLGLKIDIARNGREALETLATKQTPSAPIDLVLMDIMMPEMDGLTAMREIRKKQEWQKLPIIALTAKAMPNDQQECLAAGANDYLAKPLDVEKLLSLLRVWMPR